jgi:hypothetical protein
MNTEIETISTEIISKYDSICYVASDYVGRLALHETYEGIIMEGTLEAGSARPHADLIITFESGGWANTGSYIYLAD